MEVFMEEFYLKIGMRVPNSQIKKIISMGTILREIGPVDSKESFSKYSESQSMTFKVISNVEIPELSFLRSMLESCLGVSVDDMSLSTIGKEEYLEQTKIPAGSTHSDEILECIEKIKHYKKSLKGKKIKNFDYDLFKKSGKNFIEQLKIAHESPKTHLEHSDFRYFRYQDDSKEASLCEIILDIIE